MTIFRNICCALAILCITTHAYAQQSAGPFSIAAIVGDDAITRYDLESRMALVLATSDLSEEARNPQTLAPRILRSLIDEQLQLQEAQRKNIDITNAEIEAAISAIEQDRGRPAGSFKAHLNANNVDYDTLYQQLRAQLAWTRLLQKRMLPKLSVSQAELDREMEFDMRQKRNVAEVKLASIIVPVNGERSPKAAEALADSFAQKLQKGEPLDSVMRDAQQNGVVATTSSWIAQSQLNPTLEGIISAFPSLPSATNALPHPAGFQVVIAQEKRTSDYATDAEVLFKEIMLNLEPNAQRAEVELLMTIARDVRNYPGQCGTKTIAGEENLDDLDFDVNYTRTLLSSLSPQVLPLVRSLKVNEISEPFATPEGIRLLKLCEKLILPAKKQDTAKMERKVKEEKYRLGAMKYLRDLRRDAFIDVRL